ncbi:hypothetical protein GCM10022217_39680 [Chryseobacterium ginsenosidimutans]|uniref:hypothetical protein n=1 Tax=Chryseobacterium ginsenosidimutans TaxID=687846 RepID=UPI0031D5B5B4
MTKNLKLAIVLMLTIVGMSVNAQKKATVKTTKSTTESKTVKPTKQETIDWIGGKMKEKLAGNREFISFSNGEFVYRKQVGVYSCDTTIYLNKITGSSSEYSADFYVKGTGIVRTACEKGYEARGGNYNELSIGGPNYNDYSDPFEFKNDNSLVERLKKAFATLIEYNSEQKGADEKF